jgi:hypothetical protein
MAVTQEYLAQQIEAFHLPMGHEIGLACTPRCHPKAGVHARYFSGVLWLTCATCRTPLLDVHVATKAEVTQRSSCALPSA